MSHQHATLSRSWQRRQAAVVSTITLFGLALFGLAPAAVLAQRGATGPAEHAEVEPVNHLPNPYETVRSWGTLPDGRTWGSVSAVNVDVDGRHIWAGDRCGSAARAFSAYAAAFETAARRLA